MNILSEILAAALPLILQAISAILGLLLIRATETARSRWGIEIEARHREALHSAIMSGIRAALSRGLTGQAVIDAAMTYTANSVPEALEALNPSSELFKALIEGKVREAVFAAAPMVGIANPAQAKLHEATG